jgi:hypothetical protein
VTGTWWRWAELNAGAPLHARGSENLLSPQRRCRNGWKSRKRQTSVAHVGEAVDEHPPPFRKCCARDQVPDWIDERRLEA